MERPCLDQSSWGEGNSHGGGISPSLARDTVIVLDWDDTILPTSWLERLQALTANAPMRPEIQRQMSSLCTVCAKTIIEASRLGKVIIITNSAPGWVDQSCKLFMPQLSEQARSLQIFAKPISAPLTFKTGTFKRECKAFKNVISIGDGDAERSASLRLMQPTQNWKNISTLGGESVDTSRVKSVKLVDMPDCQQLISQHEMLQSRLLDVVKYDGSLDLKSRCVRSPQIVGGFKSDDVLTCQLVHFNQPARELQTLERGVNQMTPRQLHAHEDAGTQSSGKMHALLSSRMRVGQLPALNSPNLERNDSPNEMNASSTRKVQGINDTSGIHSPYHVFGSKKTGLASPFGRNVGSGRTPQTVR